MEGTASHQVVDYQYHKCLKLPNKPYRDIIGFSIHRHQQSRIKSHMDFSQAVLIMPDDVLTPRDELWAPFTHAVFTVTSDWDIMKNAVEMGFGADDPNYCKLKVIEYLLANFAGTWVKKKSIEPAEVSNFLKLTMDDFFNVDIGSNAYPVAKVLVKLYSEAVNNDATGVNFVLSKVTAQAPKPRTDDIVNGAAEASSVAKVTEQMKQVTFSEQSSQSAQQPLKEAQNDSVNQDEDDGWQTVGKKKNRNRRRNNNQ